MKETIAENTIAYAIQSENGYTFFITENRLLAYDRFDWYVLNVNGKVYLKKITQTTTTETLEVNERYDVTVDELFDSLERNGIDTSMIRLKEEENE